MAFPAPQTPIRSVRRRTSRAEPIANEITSTILTVLASKSNTQLDKLPESPLLRYSDGKRDGHRRSHSTPGMDRDGNLSSDISGAFCRSLTPLPSIFPRGHARVHSFSSRKLRCRSSAHDKGMELEMNWPLDSETFIYPHRTSKPILSPEISDSGSNYTTANESASLSEDSCNERTVAHGSPESGLDMSTPKPRKPHRRISSARLIKFKASAVNDQDGRTTGEQPRRKVSLGLPINISNNEPPGLLPAFEEDTFSEQQERELEYEHRHTFIGTASVDDFLNVLETTGINTTSMARVAKAFTELAAREQLFARQHSSDPEGWELVSRITLDVADNWEDCIVQARVKLGSVTLGQFLELVPLDEKKVVSVVRVVEAFCVASRIDAEVGNGAGSKARAFRSCMVRRKSREGLSMN